ncbi:S-layer homology domain-containing protein [Paenibacillus chitinolyticus]|uniref:S-layer homology domain-containing protein n=1 Tax=Paenibacillus chitinolyticus TaxID=79263 RepID=UPI002DBDCB83|nr:S-layer homology domain-containing protein [Paenibacillus chitinolyticus]MEC0246935.1 S-layer homology domain-containing protein [Paenibacillus chitinolyticus]
MVFLRKNKSIRGVAILFGTAALLLHDDAKAVGLTTEIAAAVPVRTFSDVGGHWAESLIRKAAELNLVQGYSDGTFHPDGKITRAEFAAMLNRATKQKTDTTAAEHSLSGLQNHWSQGEVNKLAVLGFIDQGDYKDGFSPDRELTRYEMIKWISSGLAQSEPSFKQAMEDTKGTLLPTPETYKGGIASDQIPYVALVKGTGIVDGFEDSTFRLAQATTRAEVSAILMRFMEVEGNKAEQYKALNELREVGLTGSNLTTITKYKYVQDLSGEVRTFAYLKDKNIPLLGALGKMKIHRIIILDTNSESSSIYSMMFQDKNVIPPKDMYMVFSDITINSNSNNISSVALGDAMGNGITSSDRLTGEVIERYALDTLPRTNVKGFLSKGSQNRVWVTQSIKEIIPDNRSSVSYTIQTESSDEVTIAMSK